jgi:SSS family solute:Na+ symporter
VYRLRPKAQGALAALFLAAGCSAPGTDDRTGPKPTIRAWRGTTPVLDGRISPGEWDDAVHFRGCRGWTPTFTPTTDEADLSIEGWIKHDGENLYFAFRVTDDLLYGIDTPRWLPDENPKAHELTPEGFPWFGDEIEILMNCRPTGLEPAGVGAAGNGSSWQMVCNLTKSRLGGIGVGGLLEGEPRSNSGAWDTYQGWIRTGAMEAAARPLPGGKGYEIEWKIRPNPCLEVKPGVFWSPSLGETRLGLNIAVGDLDRKEQGRGNFACFHHEDWWSGGPRTRTDLNNFGTLILMPGPP